MNLKQGFFTPIVIAIFAILAIGGLYYYDVNRGLRFHEVFGPNPNINTSTTTTPTDGLKTYTNDKYGFTFQYPTNWIFSESTNQDSVIISSGTSTDNSVSGKTIEDISINFKVVSNGAFGEQKTKVGDIKYDLSREALVDILSSPVRCLNYRNLGSVNQLPAFLYGGSSMSTPAHWEYAILTNQDYMLQVNELVDVESAAITSLKNKIYSSLSFIGKVQLRVPECAASENNLVGNDKDIHGCIGSAGYSWCAVKNKCLRVWEEKCESPQIKP